jgi:thiamine kinase-like enzyme
MQDINFYSNSTYIALPTKNKPRVELAINEKLTKSIAFKLYQPFSFKAKLLKRIGYLFPLLNRFEAEKSDFVLFLEKRYQKAIITSVYHATAKDKVVLQLQSDSKLIGYMKVGITASGNQRITNEIKALKLLKHLNTPKLLDSGEYLGHKFVFISAINGEQIELSFNTVTTLLKSLHSTESQKYFLLKDHPRTTQIKDCLKAAKQNEFMAIFNDLDLVIQTQLCYEHGDFAPWNILKSDGELALIDFEYFKADGIQEFDLIKYYYQIGSLLKKHKKQQLISYVESNTKLKYFSSFFKLYLLKEVCIKLKEKKITTEEYDLLKLLEKTK